MMLALWAIQGTMVTMYLYYLGVNNKEYGALLGLFSGIFLSTTIAGIFFI